MKDSLSGRVVDYRAVVPDGWEGHCVLCRRRLTWRHVRGEMVGVLHEGPLIAPVCKRHLDVGTAEQIVRIGRLLAAELERQRGALIKRVREEG